MEITKLNGISTSISSFRDARNTSISKICTCIYLKVCFQILSRKLRHILRISRPHQPRAGDLSTPTDKIKAIVMTGRQIIWLAVIPIIDT